MNFSLSTAQSIASTSLPPSANSNSLSQQTQMETEISTLEQPQTSGSLPASSIQQQSIAEDPQQQQPMPGISISNQKTQQPQFTKPGVQTQRQTNSDAAGKSDFKESTATPQHPLWQQRQPDQAQQAQLLSQQQHQQKQEKGQIAGGASQMDVTSQLLLLLQQQQQQQADEVVQQQQQAMPMVVWSGIMEFWESVSSLVLVSCVDISQFL